MYLAKFFHRPPGDDDRELLFIPDGDPIIIGIHMDRNSQPESDQFMREDFSDIGIAVAAFRRHASELVAAGYMETAHTRYTLRTLLPDPKAKPEWQKGLDDLMLAALSAPLEEQAKHLAALENTPAAREPLYLWLAAHHSYAAADNDERTIRFAKQARDTLTSRKAGKTPHYAWSIAPSDLEGRILDVLSWTHQRAGRPAAALEAVEEAYKIAPSSGPQRSARDPPMRTLSGPARGSLRRRLPLEHGWRLRGDHRAAGLCRVCRAAQEQGEIRQGLALEGEEAGEQARCG